MNIVVSHHDEGLRGVAQTARWTAAARARESRRADRLFDDPLADLLAGAEGAALLAHFHTAHAADEGNPYLPIRTRWFDDFLRRNVRPGAQVVGLGAGLDTRAYRLRWPEGTVLFEIDQPELLAYKEKCLSRVDATTDCPRRTVPVDLGDDWAARLLDGGYDPSAPSVWFAEGLFFYLPEPLARRVLATVAGLCAPGSPIALDLIGTGVFRLPYMRPFLRRLAESGSPWVFGTDTPTEFLRECGWHPEQITEPGRAGANYGRWPRRAAPVDIPNLPRSFLAAASVGRRHERGDG